MSLKSFYSILFVQPRPEIGERLALGLFLVQGSKIIFHTSTSKLNLLKIALSKDAYDSVKDAVISMHRAIKNISQPDHELYQEHHLALFDYLARYSNNLITYSSPVPIDLDFSQQNYRLLFEAMVAPAKELDDQPKKKDRFVKRITEQLFPQIKGSVNTEIEVNEEHFPGLLVPVPLDFIGKNGIIVSGHIIDFNRPEATIRNDINKFSAFHWACVNERKSVHSFIIINEPSEDKSFGWRFLDNLQKQNSNHTCTENELDSIVSYIREHDVKPFLGSN